MALKKDKLNQIQNMFTENISKESDAIKNLDKEVSTKAKKPSEKPNKTVKEVFSFRAGSDDVLQYRSYCFAKYGMTVDQIGKMAMDEFIQNHPLAKFENDLYKSHLEEEKIKYQDLIEKRHEKLSK